MLIDSFSEKFFDELDRRAAELVAPNKLYLLIDGAFVPGLHRAVAADLKTLLFASRPGFNNEAADASPFLTPYTQHDKALRKLLRRCSGWPMVSVIETPESIEQLAARLSAWCVVEADGQRFNFRFPDTRRLPAIFRTLHTTQRAQFVGPATHWSYVGRSGRLNDLDVTRADADPADDPILDDQQFASLVEDSRADQLLALFSERGYEVGQHPSVSHARVTAALRVAISARLPDDDMLPWCTWFWQQAALNHDADVLAAFKTWDDLSFTEKQE